MKKYAKKVVALLLACLLLCTCLVACGSKNKDDKDKDEDKKSYKVQGTYTAWVGEMDIKMATLTFDKDKVTYEFLLSGTKNSGTWEFKDGLVLCQYDDGGQETLEYREETDELSLGDALVFTKSRG